MATPENSVSKLTLDAAKRKLDEMIAAIPEKCPVEEAAQLLTERNVFIFSQPEEHISPLLEHAVDKMRERADRINGRIPAKQSTQDQDLRALAEALLKQPEFGKRFKEGKDKHSKGRE